MKKHVEEVCSLTKDCQDKFCVLRHPKMCRTFAAFGKCKFSKCAYLHSKEGTNLKIEILENEVGELKQKVEQLIESNHHMKLEIENISKEREKKCEDELEREMSKTKKEGIKCKQCDYKCERENTLKKHINTKHGEIHKCKECGKNFNEKDLRDLHELIDHKPKAVEYGYPCILCKKECTNIVDFSEHMETVHSTEENITCKKCGTEVTIVDLDTWCTCHMSDVILQHSNNLKLPTEEEDNTREECQCKLPVYGQEGGTCRCKGAL